MRHFGMQHSIAHFVGRANLIRAIGAIVVVAAFATLALVGPALAQKKITLDEFVIEGNIQKPEALFILPRTSLNFAELERHEDLKVRIIQAVDKKPF